MDKKRTAKGNDPLKKNKVGKIISISVSKKKGTRKIPSEEAFVIENKGIDGDAHAGPWHRQVSFLASESIERAQKQGLKVGFGDFAENIATSGIDWINVPVGTEVQLGDSVLIEITQIGKECHNKCAIYYQAGDCIMPKEGIFGRVLKGGRICCGDEVELRDKP